MEKKEKRIPVGSVIPRGWRYSHPYFDKKGKEWWIIVPAERGWKWYSKKDSKN